MAAVGASAFFTDVLTHVFTGVFADVFTDVFPDVVTGAFTGAFTDENPATSGPAFRLFFGIPSPLYPPPGGPPETPFTVRGGRPQPAGTGRSLQNRSLSVQRTSCSSFGRFRASIFLILDHPFSDLNFSIDFS